MKFLTSSVELKMTDGEVAKYLAKAKLSERLDDVTIEKLLARASARRPERPERAAGPVADPVHR